MKLKIIFAHFHAGNDADFKHRISTHGRPAPIYATCAKIIDLDSGIPLEEAWAYCSPRDVPSRKRGRLASLGRLKKKVPKAEFDEALKNTPQLRPKVQLVL